jgi:hypothetical protein
MDNHLNATEEETLPNTSKPQYKSLTALEYPSQSAVQGMSSTLPKASDNLRPSNIQEAKKGDKASTVLPHNLQMK